MAWIRNDLWPAYQRQLDTPGAVQALLARDFDSQVDRYRQLTPKAISQDALDAAGDLGEGLLDGAKTLVEPFVDPTSPVSRRPALGRPGRALGWMLAAVSLSMGVAGCANEEEGGMRIDWDLSGRHTRAEITWPAKYWGEPTTQIEPVESVRIRLPEGKVLRMDDHAESIILYRRSQGPEPLPGPEGEILDTVEVYSDPLTVEEAYRRALPYVEHFDLPRAALDSWRERRERGVDPVTDRTRIGYLDARPLGGKDGPDPFLELNYSSDDERPWIVMVRLYWPSADRP